MHIRRGLFRLYLVLSVLWVGWFGYEIYDSGRSVTAARDFIQTYNNERRLGRPSAYDIAELVKWQSQESARQKSAERAVLAFPVLVPILYFLCNWIVRGFRRDKQGQNAPEALHGKRVKPASTLLLILSILAFPIVWLIDPGAMANFWVARGGRQNDDQK